MKFTRGDYALYHSIGVFGPRLSRILEARPDGWVKVAFLSAARDKPQIMYVEASSLSFAPAEHEDRTRLGTVLTFG